MSALQPKGVAPLRKKNRWNKRNRLLCLTRRETFRRFRSQRPVYTTVASLEMQMGRVRCGNILVAAPFTEISNRRPAAPTQD